MTYEARDLGASLTPFVLYLNTSGGRDLLLPIWLPTLICAALTAVTSVPWSIRFSLRTLLFATTLVAAALGLLVFVMRR